MKTTASQKNIPAEEKKKLAEEKKQAPQPHNDQPTPSATDGEDEENPFGGMKAGNFKKNLGCGG